MRVVVQVRELVSSNVSSMVETATNPEKMLNHLRSEIEEADIALHGEITQLKRRRERTESAAVSAADEAKGWSDKAKVAMNHEREDLARSALLAKEDCKLKADNLKQEAKGLDAEIVEARTALEELQAKREEAVAQISEIRSGKVAQPTGNQSPSDSRTQKRMDRIANLERRVELNTANQGNAPKSHATVDAEIEGMRREASVDAELEKLRKSSKPKRSSKRK